MTEIDELRAQLPQLAPPAASIEPISSPRAIVTKLSAQAEAVEIADAAGMSLEDTLERLEAAALANPHIRENHGDAEAPVWKYNVFGRTLWSYLGVQFEPAAAK